MKGKAISIAASLASWPRGSFPATASWWLRDTDGADCVDLKARLRASCEACGRPETLVRLVCQELESWYLGDLAALAQAFEAPKVDTPATRKRFVRPDDWQKPSVEVKRLVPGFQKTGGARAMARHLSLCDNRSHSFQVFVEGVRRIAAVESG